MPRLRRRINEDRFKSILVEGSADALSTMAAYIDLNAVRAGIVEDPKDYRFCGYGEAVAGGKDARHGMAHIAEDIFQAHREEFGLKRKTGARKPKHGEWGDLCTMRDLRLAPITLSKAA